MKFIIKLFILFSFQSNYLYSQARDPRPKDQANVFWDGTYPLYSLVSDKQILPRKNGYYVYYATTNEDPTPIEYTVEKGEVEYVYKFISWEECLEFCNQIRSAKGMPILKDEDFGGVASDITFEEMEEDEIIEENVNAQTTGASVVNRNNSIYNTVTINGITWMTQNLGTTTFRNGDNILEAKTEDDLFRYNKIKMPCYMKNRITAEDGTVIEYLTYNWYAISDIRGIAPIGFHISTNSEWDNLIKYCGGATAASTILRSSRGYPLIRIPELNINKECPNCKNWNSEYRSKIACHVCKDTRKVYDHTEKAKVNNTNGTNSLGFNWQYKSVYVCIGDENPGSFYSADKCLLFDIFGIGPVIKRQVDDDEYIWSVRCVKD